MPAAQQVTNNAYFKISVSRTRRNRDTYEMFSYAKVDAMGKNPWVIKSKNNKKAKHRFIVINCD